MTEPAGETRGTTEWWKEFYNIPTFVPFPPCKINSLSLALLDSSLKREPHLASLLREGDHVVVEGVL